MFNKKELLIAAVTMSCIIVLLFIAVNSIKHSNNSNYYENVSNETEVLE